MLMWLVARRVENIACGNVLAKAGSNYIATGERTAGLQARAVY